MSGDNPFNVGDMMSEYEQATAILDQEDVNPEITPAPVLDAEGNAVDTSVINLKK